MTRIRAHVRTCVLAVIASACGCNGILGIEDVVVDEGSTVQGRDGGGSNGGDAPTDPLLDAASPTDSGGPADAADTADAADAALPQPDPGCMMAKVDRASMDIAFSPSPGSTQTPLQVTVTDQSQGFTNVNIVLCTPTSATPIVNESATVISGSPPYAWRFDAGKLPRGVTQVGFRSDPSKNTLRETAFVTVE